MRLPLQVCCFLLMVCGAHCFTNILRGIRGLVNYRHIESSPENIHEDVKEASGAVEKVQIPERLFSKELARTRKSYCHQARLEFGKLCGLRSAGERAKLASLVTNCHLEVSGRPVFVWDPEKKLADASEHYVYLVMQFIPLMNDVCEKAGYSPLFSQLVADTKNNEDIGNKLDELQAATERLFEANRQSSEFVTEYVNMSAEASRKLKQMLALSLAIKEANDVINKQWEGIHQEANDIKAEMRAFTKNSVSLFDSMFGRFEGFQRQMSTMSSAVGQIQSDSRATNMFLKDPLEAISNTTSFMDSPQETSPDYITTLPLGPFRKVGFLTNVILGPIKLSERIRHLEKNRFIGPYAKDIFSSLQLLLILLSIYIAYTMLTMFTKILEAVLRFAAVFRPFKPLVARASNLCRIGYQSEQTDQEQRIKEHFSEHISASISEALASSKLAERVAKLVRNDDADSRSCLMFARISELDMRLSQISQDVRLLHQVLQPLDRLQTRELRTSVLSHGTVAVQNEHVKELLTTSMVTDAESTSCASANEYNNSSNRVTAERRKKTFAEENEFSERQLIDSTNREKVGDMGDNNSQKGNNGAVPKRELPRRRSSRRR